MIEFALMPFRLGTRTESRGSTVIDKLEFLIALAREKHFGRAAEVCNVTQPTLSSGIKQLEETLNTLLVNRGSRFEGFTPEGERVLEWARRIVAHSRAMRQDLDALKRGLTGEIRIAAVPTALPMVVSLTTPYRAAHPDVRFTVWSRTSVDALTQLENLEVDAAVTYIDNEPLGRVTSVPLYRERYRFLTSADAPLGDRERVTWAEVGKMPLCLLTTDMQNRRIIDQILRSVGVDSSPALQSNSMVLLFSHVRTGRWASIMPAVLADNLGLTPAVRSIPIDEPDVSHVIGLVVPQREPMTPLVAALVAEDKIVASRLQEATS
jgi:DNA-binding transcriptional LysR family regulator